MINCLPPSCTFLYANKLTLIELSQVENVIKPCPETFGETKSNQIIGKHDTIHKNCDIDVETALKTY